MKIPKKRLDKIIAMTREYWSAGDTTILQKRIDMADAMEKETNVSWSAILYLIDGILQNKGFCVDATNEKIYAVLSLLGWCLDEEHPAE